jgi:hypothetical protein
MIVETILWKSVPWPGHETARLIAHDAGFLLEGAAAFAHEGQSCRLDYVIECDAAWATRRATVEGWVATRAIDVAIEVANGVWTLNGDAQPQLAGCIDVDLNFSPSTNLLPIRRLNLGIGESGDVRAAWLRFPSFALEVLEQRYTRVAGDRIRYESLTTNFAAELRVSANGFVVEYENVWIAEAGS